jgi:hypothetical protein
VGASTAGDPVVGASTAGESAAGEFVDGGENEVVVYVTGQSPYPGNIIKFHISLFAKRSQIRFEWGVGGL